MNAPGAVLDQDQRIDALEQDGVDVDEVDGEDAVGLEGQELAPARAAATRRRIDPGVVQDAPTVEAAI